MIALTEYEIHQIADKFFDRADLTYDKEEQFAIAIIAANNAKVLQNIEPDTHCVDTDTNTDVWSYSSSQVAAMIQERNEALLTKGFK